MLPTLHEGSTVLISPWVYFFHSPRIHDLVVLYDPKDREVVKRIVEIEKGSLFVQGDNKQASTDSRNYGAVTRKQIIGKVIYAL